MGRREGCNNTDSRAFSLVPHCKRAPTSPNSPSYITMQMQLQLLAHELCLYLHSSLPNSRAYLRPFSVFSLHLHILKKHYLYKPLHPTQKPQTTKLRTFLKCLLLLFTLHSCISCSCFLVLISLWPDDSSPLALQAPWLGLCLQETEIT